MVLDELLGAVNACLGLGAYTGTLTVRYERPTPIGEELTFDAWVDRTEGRKVFTLGTISAGDVVTEPRRGRVHPRRASHPGRLKERTTRCPTTDSPGACCRPTPSSGCSCSRRTSTTPPWVPGTCSSRTPGSTVCTVFAGAPDRYPGRGHRVGRARAGSRRGDDVVAARREEDLAALEVLGAHHLWLDFPDHQYLEPDDRPTADDVAPAIAAAIDTVAPDRGRPPDRHRQPRSRRHPRRRACRSRGSAPTSRGSPTRTPATSTSRG